jgi:hypothetical protein
VTRGMLCWPCIGWDVLFLRGVQPSPELQYMDPIIPPPMHACVGDDVPIEAILFSKREFKLSGQEIHGTLLLASTTVSFLKRRTF